MVEKKKKILMKKIKWIKPTKELLNCDCKSGKIIPHSEMNAWKLKQNKTKSELEETSKGQQLACPSAQGSASEEL